MSVSSRAPPAQDAKGQKFKGPPCFDEASTVRRRLVGTQPWLKLEINAMFLRTTSGKRLKFSIPTRTVPLREHFVRKDLSEIVSSLALSRLRPCLLGLCLEIIARAADELLYSRATLVEELI